MTGNGAATRVGDLYAGGTVTITGSCGPVTFGAVTGTVVPGAATHARE